MAALKRLREINQARLSLSEDYWTGQNITRVYQETFGSQAPVVINRGGARSSKSYSVGQSLANRFLHEHDRSFLITRKTFPSLRISAYKLLLSLFKAYGMYDRLEHNKTNHELINPNNNNLMLFSSVDDSEKIKSTEWNYIWMEEATDFILADYRMLKLRLSAPTDGVNQLHMSFNPVDAFHWIKTEVIDKAENGDVCEIVSTYKDNPHLSAAYIKELEKLEREDVNYWRIYGLGEWGLLKGLILSNWDICQSWPATFEDEIYGLDFGFNNPTALIHIGIKDQVLYWDERLYETEMTNRALIERMKTMNLQGSLIYADSEDPARIKEIQLAGFNCKPTVKGKGSVVAGIDMLKAHRICVQAKDINLISELRGYKWKEDKDGKPMDEPVKYNDHAIDAGRGALFTHWGGDVPNIRILEG